MNTKEKALLETLALAIEKKESLTDDERVFLAGAARAAISNTSSKAVCVLCDESFTAKAPKVEGFLKKGLKPAFVHQTCADDYRMTGLEFGAWCDSERERQSGKHFVFDKDAMALCACSHNTFAHQADELDNLLQCSHCDCDHFHYDIAA